MKSPKAQAPTPPPVPSKDEAAAGSVDTGASKRRGYQSTILGGRQTANAEANPLKTLLGQ
jgi:hypothetical protein